MKVELRIALRYLLSRKSYGAVNVISAVAMAGVAVAAAALIVVLSVFNGFAQLVDNKTSNFNPPFLAVPQTDAFFANSDSVAAELAKRNDGLRAFPIIDEQGFAMSAGADGQMPVNFRAIPSDALPASGVGNILAAGELRDSAAVLSVGVAMQLNLHPGDSIRIVVPRRLGRVNPGAPQHSFRTATLPVAAIYQVEQEEQDRDMLILPLPTARNLLSYSTEATSIALYPTDRRSDLLPVAEPGINILDRRAQEGDTFRMIAIEKWITFLMLSFILLIASFNIISTMSLMVVEKQPNMSVLRSIGASPTFIRNIFTNQAWLITLGGGIAGLLIGALLILGQQHYGWVPLATSNPGILTTTSYPVQLTLPDLLVSLLTLLILSLLLAAFTRRLPSTK